jgi:hypothetical protein
MSIPNEESFARECQIERTPSELKRWADEQLQQIASNPAGKSAIRMGRGIAKQFVEEVYPLSVWAARIYGDRQDVRCRPVFGNQPYDAVIVDDATTQSRQNYLELTQATDGYDDHLRMEHMERHGGVSMIGKPQRSGTRAERGVHVPFEAANHGTLIGQAYEQVRSALVNKTSKSYGAETSLLVMMNDVYFEWDGDFTDLDKMLLDWATASAPTFNAVYVMGWQGRVGTAVHRNVSGDAWCMRRI